MKLVFGTTNLEQDLHMPDEELNASYAQQWLKFERERWWPWYEQWGRAFFAPEGSAEPNPPTVVKRTRKAA